MRSILGVPLKRKDRVIGVIQVVDTRPYRFNIDQISVMELLSANLATSIENAQLFARAQSDAQTQARLLDEVNHRVKNNLSSIAGLLYTQRRYAAEHEYAILDDLIERIEGLSTVHKMLSEAEWQPLVLSDLVRTIIENVSRAVLDDLDISYTINESSVRLSPKLANSMAIIINELVTNSIKHAEPGTDTIQLHINVSHSHDDGTTILQYEDDGPGYPKEVLAFEKHSVGLYLMRDIVRYELRGDLEICNARGAAVRIIFRNRKS
jgi:ribose transport system ATP-binding protein